MREFFSNPVVMDVAFWFMIVVTIIGCLLAVLSMLLNSSRFMYWVHDRTRSLHICPRCHSKIRVMWLPPLLTLPHNIPTASYGYIFLCNCTKGRVCKTKHEAYMSYIQADPENRYRFEHNINDDDEEL